MTDLTNKAVGLFRRYRKLAWLCLLTAISAICLILWLWILDVHERRPPQIPKPISAAVSFQGYSNSPTVQRWAILTITNRDFGNLYCVNPMTLEFADQPLDWPENRWITPDFIPPGSCGRIAVEIPPAPGVWRLRFLLSRYTWKDPIYNALSSRGWPDWLIPVRPTHTLGDLVTEWVTNDTALDGRQRLEAGPSDPN